MRKAIAVGMKEFRQIRRDRRTLMILLFIPVFFLLLYGYALNFDIRHVRFAVVDHDRSVQSRSLISAFANSGYFDLVGLVSDGDISPLMDRNEVRAIVVIPARFGADVAGSRPVAVQVLLNVDNANTATTVMGYAGVIIRSESARYQPLPAQAAITAEPRVWYNPELKSALFLVPGLIAYIAMITAVVSTALSTNASVPVTGCASVSCGVAVTVSLASFGPMCFLIVARWTAGTANVKICRLCTKAITIQLVFVADNQTKATVWMRSPSSFVFRAQTARAGSDRNYRPAGWPVENEPQIAAMATPFNFFAGTWLGHSGVPQ